ncbi:hypothetical protein [Enterococcus bulliens]
MFKQKVKHLGPFIGCFILVSFAIIACLRSILLFFSLQLTAKNIQAFIASSNYKNEEQEILSQLKSPFTQLLTHYQTTSLVTSGLLLLLIISFFYYVLQFYLPNASTRQIIKKIAGYISLILLAILVIGLFFQPQVQFWLEQNQQNDLLNRTQPTYFSLHHFTSDIQNGLTVRFPATDFALFQANDLSTHQWTFLLLGVIGAVWSCMLVWLLFIAYLFQKLRQKSQWTTLHLSLLQTKKHTPRKN